MTVGLRVLFAAALAALAVNVQAGDAAAGKTKTATCQACHGVNGIAAIPNYPNLAGQKEQYLIEAIKAYKSGARNNPIMKPMVAALTDADIENIAAYYASLDCK